MMEQPGEIEEKPESRVEEKIPTGEEKPGTSEVVEEEIEVEDEEVIVAGEEIVEGDVQEQMPDNVQVVDGEEIIFADDEEYGIEYDAMVNLSTERNLLFDMYQPVETESGQYLCKICMRTGKNTAYPDRNTFVAHRYKCHGSFNNNVICPMPDCREVYASLYTLRRHLGQQHELPLEIHQQSFENIGEFEKFRHLVEITSGCRYMMHTKQPKYRRQVMHCAKSEHKLVLQTQKHRLPRERMSKEGSACPSVISYRVDPSNGQVHTFMQLYHIGHAPDHESLVQGNPNSARPMDIVFPQKPPCLAERPMQYVQIDVHCMQPAIYGNKIYESILVVTCLKSKFMWAKPLLECTRTAIGRILNQIFNEFGVPEGFSTTYSPTYIRDTLKALESVYAVEIREIWSEPPPYASLEHWVMEVSEQELQSRNRWVEQLQFVIMEYNQRHVAGRSAETPFEKMFNRKPPHLYGNNEEVLTKSRRYHYELRQEDGEVGNTLNTSFHPGDKVFLRKGITKPRRGNNTQYYFGVVGERDHTCKHYPYKVHFSSTDSPWPTDRNMFVWVSVYDLLPTTHKIREMAFEDRQEAIAGILCTCSGQESNQKYDMSAVGPLAPKASKCLLFRNILCANQMSRHCCKTDGRHTCKFHELYPEHDESYTKMEVALLTYCQQNKLREEEKNDEKEELEELVNQQQQQQIGKMSSRRSAENEEEDEDQELIEVEEIVEEILPPGSSEHLNMAAGPSETQRDDFRYPPPPPQPLKRQRKRKEDQSSSDPKRVCRKKTSSEAERPSEEPSEVVAGSSESATTSSANSRRASGRRTIRPKNLDDYVE